MAHKRSHSRGYSGVIRLDERPTRALSLNYEIEKRQAMCRDIKDIFSKGFKLAREQTFEPVEFLFILKEESSSIFNYAGNGEMTVRFENGEPLTTDKPRLKTKYQKDMTVVNVGDNPEVDLLTSHKTPEDANPPALGRRHTIAEGHKQTLETLDIGPGTHNDVTPNSIMTMPILVTETERDFNDQTTLWDQLEELEDGELMETRDSLNPVVSGSYTCMHATEGEPQPLPVEYPVSAVKAEPLTEGYVSHSMNLTDHQMTSVMALMKVKQETSNDDAAVPVAIVQKESCQIAAEPLPNVAVKSEIPSVICDDFLSGRSTKPRDVHVPAFSDGPDLMRTDDNSRLSTKTEEPLTDDILYPVEDEDMSLGETYCQSSRLPCNIDEPFPLTLYGHTTATHGDPAKTETRKLDAAENVEKTHQDRGISPDNVRSSSPRVLSKQMKRQTASGRKKQIHSLNLPSSQIVTDRDTETQTEGNLYTFSPENYSCSNASEHGKHRTPYAQRKKNYKCLVCNYRAVAKYMIEQHVRTHTGEKPYMCPVCGYRSAAKRTLMAHIRTHVGMKPYKCTLCIVRFAKKAELLEHMRTHGGEKQFKCSLCDYKFSRMGGLTLHMRTHTGEKPYMCSVCQHRFAQKGQLVRHLRTHTGEKPYTCSLCNYRSANNGGLNSHMERHSKEKPHGCSLCDRRFSCGDNLRKHVKRHQRPKP